MLCFRCGSHVQDGAEKCWNCGAELSAKKSGASLAELREKQKTKSRISGVVYKVGDVIGNRYKVKDIVGTGGVGVVYRAHDQDVDVDVALKVVNAKLLQAAEEKRLFAREIKIAKKLSHQNIVRIYDEGKDDERAFFTMQFLEGLSLRKIIDLRKEKSQQFRLSEVEPIFNQLCQAIDYAHKSTVHGNLKPDNVIVLPDLLKVTDFGLLRGLPRKPFLAIQKSKGSNFRYLAPEVRLEVDEVPSTADVYSLGVILTEMLLGVLYDEAKPDQVNFSSSGLDSGLVRLLKRALSRNPKDRYPTAGSLYEDLKRALERGDQPVKPVAPSSPPPPRASQPVAAGAPSTSVSPPPPPAGTGSHERPSSQPSGALAEEGGPISSPARAADEAPTQRLDISKHGPRPVEETGNFAAIDDSMIEDVSKRGSSEIRLPAPLPADESARPSVAPAPAPAPAAAQAAPEGEEPTEAIDELSEISNSQIELIADPRATNVHQVAVSEVPVPPVASALPEPVEESTRAGRLDVPGPSVEREATHAVRSAETAAAPKPNLGRGAPPTERVDRVEKKNGAALGKGLSKSRPATRPRLSAVPRAQEPTISSPPSAEPRLSATGLFGKPLVEGMAAEPTAAKPLMVRGDEILRSDSRAGSRRPQPRGGDNTKLLVGVMAGFMVLLLGFAAFGFKVMSDRQAEQIRTLIDKQNELARLAAENQAKAETEVEARGAAAEDARKAQEEAEARAKAEEAARLAALEAVRKAEEGKRGEEAEAMRKQAEQAAAREAEARAKADEERKRRDSELLAQRRAEDTAAREKAAAAAAAKKARELEDKQAREARDAERRAALDEQKARRAEEDRAKKEEAARAAEEKRRAQEEAKKAEEARKKEEAAAAAAAVVPEERACPKGMALIKDGAFMMGAPMNDPDRNFGDLPYASKTVPSYCIDYYEAPNSRGKLPTTKVGFKSAEKACKGRGKRLCTEEEWEKACKGPSGSRFPYGNQWAPDACNTEDEEGNDREVVASGTFSKCRGPYNVLDLSGNVAEWTATEWSGGGAYVIKGGSADRPSYDARCASRKKKAAGAADAMLGYRCCADAK